MKYKMAFDNDQHMWQITIFDEYGAQLAVDYSLGNEEKAKDMALWMIEDIKADRGKGATIFINDDDTIKILDPGRLTDHVKRIIHCWNAAWITRSERMTHIDDMLDWIHEQPHQVTR